MKTKPVCRILAAAPLLLSLAAWPAHAQDSRDDHSHSNYYSGMREGSRGGEYDRGPHDNYRAGDDERYQQAGGIGPGKGAAIGAAGGALLGAVFGGGLKGAVIGGAAGAGVGAVAGKAAQDHRRDEY